MKREKELSTGLAAEIQQGEPFGSAATEAYLNLIRTASQLEGRVSALTKRHGISQPQYNVLRILRGAGPEGLPCGEVAARMVARVPDISRLLDRLHAAGLVTRERDHEDRRVVRIQLSDEGWLRLQRLDDPMEELNRHLLAVLSETELRRLIRLLERARSTEAP